MKDLHKKFQHDFQKFQTETSVVNEISIRRFQKFKLKNLIKNEHLAENSEISEATVESNVKFTPRVSLLESCNSTIFGLGHLKKDFDHSLIKNSEITIPMSQSSLESSNAKQIEPRNLSLKFSEIDFDRIMHDERRSSADAGFYTSSFQKKIAI